MAIKITHDQGWALLDEGSPSLIRSGRKIYVKRGALGYFKALLEAHRADYYLNNLFNHLYQLNHSPLEGESLEATGKTCIYHRMTTFRGLLSLFLAHV